MKTHEAKVLLQSLIYEELGVDCDGNEVTKLLPFGVALIAAGVQYSGWWNNPNAHRDTARFLRQLAAALEKTAAGSVAVLADEALIAERDELKNKLRGAEGVARVLRMDLDKAIAEHDERIAELCDLRAQDSDEKRLICKTLDEVKKRDVQAVADGDWLDEHRKGYPALLSDEEGRRMVEIARRLRGEKEE